VFYVQSSIEIADISFAGKYSFLSNYQTYYASCIVINSTILAGNSTINLPVNVTLSGISVAGNTQFSYIVTASLVVGSLLTVSDFSVVWQSPSLSYYPFEYILNVQSAESPSLFCTSNNLNWPEVIIQNVQVQNTTEFLSRAITFYAGLVQSSDVALTITNVTWQFPLYQLINSMTSCNVSLGLPYSYTEYVSLPPITISSLELFNTTYDNYYLVFLQGGQVTLSGLNLYNITRNSLVTYNMFVIYSESISFTNSQFALCSGYGTGMGNQYIDSSLISLNWAMTSQSQLASYSAGTNLFRNVSFLSNGLRPITTSVVFATQLNPDTPFNVMGISLLIDSCTFINNNDFFTKSPGGAIQAISAMSYGNQTYGWEDYEWTNIENVLSIVNSVFEGNVGAPYGGAIYLS